VDEGRQIKDQQLSEKNQEIGNLEKKFVVAADNETKVLLSLLIKLRSAGHWARQSWGRPSRSSMAC